MTTANFPEDTTPMAPAPLKFPLGSTAQPFNVWYRSRTPDGNIWAESSDREDVLTRFAPGVPLTFEAMRVYLVDCPWEPFMPAPESCPDPILHRRVAGCPGHPDHGPAGLLPDTGGEHCCGDNCCGPDICNHPDHDEQEDAPDDLSDTQEYDQELAVQAWHEREGQG